MPIDNVKSLLPDPLQTHGSASHGRKNRPNLTKDMLQEIRDGLADSGKQDKATSKLDNLLTNFDKVDLNGDGSISSDELKSYQKTLNQGDPKNGDQTEFTKDDLQQLRDKLSRFGGKLPQGLDLVISQFDQVDTDGDGKVSKAELDLFAKEHGIKLPRLGSLASLQNLPNSSNATPGAPGDAVDLSKFSPLAATSNNSQAAASLLSRGYTSQGTWWEPDANDALPSNVGISQIRSTKN